MSSRRPTARGLVVVLAAGLLAACNPDPGAGPTSSPSATPPSASPSATPSPTPTENAQESEQRAAFEAAEKAYRAAFAEVGRLSIKGGADEPTKSMRATMTGEYLRDQMSQLQQFKKAELQASAVGKIGWVRPDGYSPGAVELKACEDFRRVHLINRDGATTSPGDGTGTRVYRQLVSMVETSDGWKASSFKTEAQLKGCDS